MNDKLPLVKLKPPAQAVLDDWFGKLEKEILHVWEETGFYNVVVRYKNRATTNTELHFYRIFPIAGQYQISQDRQVAV